MAIVDDEKKGSVSTEEPKTDESFLQTMRKRLDRSVSNESEEREKGQDDIKFINGEQWEESVKKQRGKGRLCLTINKMPTFLDQIDGDIRLNTPSLKVKAVDNDADTKTADVIEGLVRYVQRSSVSGRIHAYAGIQLSAGGRGAWRVLTDYVDDGSFEQEIRIARIINSFSVYFDPAAEQDDKQDGMYMFVVTDMSRDEYKETYNHEPVDFSLDGSDFSSWQTESTVRVAEYFYKEKVEDKTIYLLEDGSVTVEKPKEQAKSTRKVPIYKIKWAKVDGKRVLETGDIPGKMFPIVLAWGKQLCVNGKIESRGFARHAKDAQKLYNYFRSNDAESAALQPKQPYMMPDVCLNDNFQKIWDKANDENYPYLPYHVDPSFPTHKPYREAPAMASSANQAQIQIADTEMRDTVGIQKAALGQQEGSKQSGIAIQRLKQESDTGQHAFMDNLAAGICTEGKIVVGMIPFIYDTEKQIRILGKDMKEKVVNINDGAGFDLTVGKYDVDIDVAGSYSTQREEFQEKLAILLPNLSPEQVAVTADIFFEMQDFPRADDIAERLRKLIPPEILGADEQGETMQEGEGGIPGMEGQGGMPQEPQPPDPAQIAEIQAMEAQQQALEAESQKQQIAVQEEQVKLQEEQVKLEVAQVKLEQEQVKLEGMRLDNELKIKTRKEDIAAMMDEMLSEEQEAEGPQEVAGNY